MTESETEKPAFILYFVSKFSIVIFPMSLLISAILVKLGVPDSYYTMGCAAIVAYYISEWYEELNNEVFLYVLEKAAERHAKDPENE